MATATDPLPEITTTPEKVVAESSSAHETVTLRSSSSTGNDLTSESTSGGETSVVDEKDVADLTSESRSGGETSVDEKDAEERSGQDEEEEEEECGFCIFMKGGPCGEQFKQWQNCVEGAEKSEKDIVEQCAQMTTLLKVCMEANPQYYGPVLDAEKAMQADIDSAEQTRMDGAKESSEPPAPAKEGVESGNGEQTVEVVETLDVVVIDDDQVVNE
ncbi:unnamed protein product [Calypogeia fissa]